MSIQGFFGLGSQTIRAQQNVTRGTVTASKTLRWLKVNTKPARVNGLDGAKFPHMIRFTYQVEGVIYSGSAYVSYTVRCPEAGQTIPVYYDRKDPAKYAVQL